MNPNQEKFYHFFMSFVIEGKEEMARELLLQGFERQKDNTFTKEYFESVKDQYFDLLRPEGIEPFKQAMQSFGL